jgi:hypothetical protein
VLAKTPRPRIAKIESLIWKVIFTSHSMGIGSKAYNQSKKMSRAEKPYPKLAMVLRLRQVPRPDVRFQVYDTG